MNSLALRTLKSLSIVNLWVYIFLKSLADKSGYVRTSYTNIQKLVYGARIGDKTKLHLTISQLRRKIGELAYLGIVKPKSIEERNREIKKGSKYVSPAYPIQIVPEFMSIFPNEYVNSKFDEQDMLLLIEESKRREEHIKNLNATIRKMREEIKHFRAGNNIQTVNTINKNGTLNERGAEYQRLWAWFVILGIQAAFLKITTTKDDTGLKPNYKIMAVWLSVYGINLIEGLLSKLYMNGKIEEIKKLSGNSWPDAVVRYIYGALKKMKEGEKKDDNNREKTAEEVYVPAGGWKNDDEY